MRREPKILDRRPGTVPEILAEKGSIIYVLTPPGARGGAVVIRCDPAGELWVSLSDVAELK